VAVLDPKRIEPYSRFNTEEDKRE